MKIRITAPDLLDAGLKLGGVYEAAPLRRTCRATSVKQDVVVSSGIIVRAHQWENADEAHAEASAQHLYDQMKEFDWHQMTGVADDRLIVYFRNTHSGRKSLLELR